MERLALVACVLLGACSTTDGTSRIAAILQQLGENYKHCERHITYSAGLGPLSTGASVSGSVDCDPLRDAVETELREIIAEDEQ